MKKKVAQPNIPKSISHNQTKPWEVDFRESIPYNAKHSPFTNQTLEHLADLMLLWVKSSDRLIALNKFLNIQSIYHSNLLEWAERCPKLKDAYLLTTQILGTNREEITFFKEGDQKTMAFMQGTYDPRWKAQEKYFNELKAEVANQQSGTINIKMTGHIPQVEEDNDSN